MEIIYFYNMTESINIKRTTGTKIQTFLKPQRNFFKKIKDTLKKYHQV